MSQPKESKSGEAPSIGQRLEEARAVAAHFGCSVVITASGENGTALIPIGQTRELSALAPEQQHVIYALEGTQVFPTGAPRIPVSTDKPVKQEEEKEDERAVKPRKKGKVHDLTGFTGFWRGTFYQDGIAQNGKNGHNNRKKR